MQRRAALIATIRNEEAALPAFLFSIKNQTRRPDLVVVTSGLSDDMTDDILQEWEDAHHDDRFVWLPLGAGNRSFGRNEAVRFAMEEGIEIIACTNAGVLDPSWLERIVEPIEAGRADVVGGGYRIVTKNAREEAAAKVTQYTPKEAARKQFVTALSMAFTVDAWRSVGGFPEDLDTSEDTVFVQRLRDASVFDSMGGADFPRYKFAYAVGAIVNWRPSTLTIRSAYRTYKQFAGTDRRAKVMPAQYFATTYAYIMPLILAALGQAPLGLLVFAAWVLWRARKELFGIPYVLAVDIGRLRGFWLP